MDDLLKNRLRSAGFGQFVEGETSELVKALLAECESARSRAEMRGKEVESVRVAMKTQQSELWVHNEMYKTLQQQWAMALRKIHQMASDADQNAGQNPSR